MLIWKTERGEDVDEHVDNVLVIWHSCQSKHVHIDVTSETIVVQGESCVLDGFENLKVKSEWF